jgi:ankyrin repeat protein/TPR repeat protein
LAYAKIYKWVDENGVKHFSETPPENQGDSSIENSDATPQESNITSSETNYNSGFEAVSKVSYVGTQDSLRSIQRAAIPAAYDGNKIAIHICRQTMYGLDDDAGLEKLPLVAAKPMATEIIAAWSKLVDEKADMGDPFFKTVLAVLHIYGDGVAKDPQSTLRLLEEAADGGYPDALVKLGHVYHKGQLGTVVDYKKALSYYQQAAQQDSPTAIYYIGVIYYHGRGVPGDHALAFNYFQKAADLGYTEAQNDVGLCYLNGHGVPMDRSEAIKWLKIAAKAGNSKAMNTLLRLGVNVPVSQKKLKDTNMPPGREVTSASHRDIPQNFRNVEICSSSLEGIYQHIRLCDIDTLDRLLQADMNLLNSKNSSGWTPMTMAVASGCTNMTAYLVDKGANINETHQRYNFTPLHIAVLTGQKEIVKLLINNGADLNVVCNSPSQYYWFGRLQGTPLHTAIYNRRYAILELLLENGADYNIKDQDGRTLFEFAVDLNKRERIVRIYNKVGLPVPHISATVEELMSAISDCGATSTRKKGQKRVRQLLKTDPGLIHQKDKHGSTPLHLAAFYHLGDIIRLLVEKGADVNAKNKRGNTPLHKISHDKDIAQFLIASGARVNEQDNSGQTPLHKIAGYADVQSGIDVAKILLANGASKSIQDNSGRTPYEIAQQNGFSQVAAILQM